MKSCIPGARYESPIPCHITRGRGDAAEDGKADAQLKEMRQDASETAKSRRKAMSSNMCSRSLRLVFKLWLRLSLQRSHGSETTGTRGAHTKRAGP